METNEEMASSMVEEQFNDFRVKKVIEEEAKNPLGWWRIHEAQISYLGFVAQQIMRIVGSQIEAKKGFSIASFCTNT
jgi:hypothetical protein